LKKKLEITVYGMVQGVGFRPFVAGLADEIGLDGNVRNSGGIVHITAAGEEDRLDEFIKRLSSDAPKESVIQRIECHDGEMEESENRPAAVKRQGKIESAGQMQAIAKPGSAFFIVQSTRDHDRIRLLPPDLATCPACARELLDPKNRRFRYPFISCTVCGPRFSILEDIPYDRETITMKKFPMCKECEREYRTPGDRRRHAQTIACHDCGPVLRSLERNEEHTGEEALDRAISLLKAGKVIALKDIGGFHFAFRADSETAAKRLRAWKNRERKPFAVMFPDLSSIEAHCFLNPKEKDLLQSRVRPIVLVRQKDRKLWPEVSAYSDRMGVMLPSDPLQILILREPGPLVMTSGNRGGEPIAIESSGLIEAMREGFPDLILDHDRDILTPLDDSIYQMSGEEVQILRRARGLVPDPIWLSRKCKADTFASGGDLKNTFALARDNAVYLSGHFGDLEWRACQEARDKSIRNMERLLDIHPLRFAGDLHPAYISARLLSKMADETNISFYQHHLAHIAGVLAECGLTGDCLGLAFDGTGYGTDGSVWGSEFLQIHQDTDPKDGKDTLTWQRVGSLVPIRQIGGDEGARDGRKSLFSYLMKACEEGLCREEELRSHLEGLYPDKDWRFLHAAYQSGINSVTSTSMGRLFDAAAALLEISDRNNYEGESPIRLETEAWECDILKNAESLPAELSEWNEKNYLERKDSSGNSARHSEKIQDSDSEHYIRRTGSILEIDGPAILYDLLMEKESGAFSKAELAYHFHQKLIGAVTALTEELVRSDKMFRTEADTEPGTATGSGDEIRTEAVERAKPAIALAGGTFLNRILFQGVKQALEARGFQVFFNRLVPPGDGGLSLGQVYLSTYDQVAERK
jgi:hydrogenase maturation protein HypF